MKTLWAARPLVRIHKENYDAFSFSDVVEKRLFYKENYDAFSFSDVVEKRQHYEHYLFKVKSDCLIQTPILPYFFSSADYPKRTLEVGLRVETAPDVWTRSTHWQFAKPIQRDIFHFLLACRQPPFSWFYVDLRDYMCQKLVEIHGDTFKGQYDKHVVKDGSAPAFYNLLKRAEKEICQLACEQHFANQCVDPLLETVELVKIKETAADEVSNFARIHTVLIQVPFTSQPLNNLIDFIDYGNYLQTWIEFRIPAVMKESQAPILTVSRHE